MDGLVGLGGLIAIMLVFGLAYAIIDRRHFDARWLLAAVLLVVINDAMLTNLYGAIPNFLPGDRNWQGKLLALLASLAIVALPMFGWRKIGLRLEQRSRSLRPALMVAVVYLAFIASLAMLFPNEPPTREELAFQLTMPGIEEEIFYRGLLLLALDRAFTVRQRLFGVDWGWGAVISCMLFGLLHAFGYSDGAFHFDLLIFALTGLPAFLVVWLRYRTGSLILPITMHNLGNVIFTVI